MEEWFVLDLRYFHEFHVPSQQRCQGTWQIPDQGQCVALRLVFPSLRDGSQKEGAISFAQVEGVGQSADGVGIRTFALTAFECADRIQAETGAGSEFFLRQTSNSSHASPASGESPSRKPVGDTLRIRPLVIHASKNTAFMWMGSRPSTASMPC